MQLIQRIFYFKGAPLLMAAFAVLIVAEGRIPLRKRKQPRWQQVFINTLVSVPACTLLRFLFLPLIVRLVQKNRHWQWVLDCRYWTSPLLKATAVFLVMDYTNYRWHVLNHKWTFLWRFYLVHHSDPDLDLTTALRFHFGELIGSVFYRGFFAFLSGATPLKSVVVGDNL